MYVNGYMLFAIYSIAVLALAVSVYALWSLEEIRLYYEKNSQQNHSVDHYHKNANHSAKHNRQGHWN